MSLIKIVSGGQTGVDRGALDAALDHGFPCGGWCPEGRLADDGPIPKRYPLQELAGAGYRQRTIRNLEESDGTLIIYYGKPLGGTELTLLECIRRHKPYVLIDATLLMPDQAATGIQQFVVTYSIGILNVAGPGAKREVAAAEYAYAVVCKLIAVTSRPGS